MHLFIYMHANTYTYTVLSCVYKYIYDVYMCGCVEKLASGHTCIIMYLDRSVMHDLCVCA